MSRFIAVVLAVVVGLFFVGSASAQAVVAPAPASEPAWCGQSWWPGTVNEKGERLSVGGTSFGQCMPVSKEAIGKDGKAAQVSVPTHPAYPVTTFTQQKDGTWIMTHPVMQKDKDGKDVTVQQAIEPIVVQSPAKGAVTK